MNRSWKESTRIAAIAACTILLASAPHLHGLPEGEQVTHGAVEFDRGNKTLTINQETGKAIVHYDRFNIAGDESVRFNQPSASSTILNRVTGGGSSTIAGALSGNGNVYLINRSGILFSSSSRVNVHGLVASSMELSNSDFLSGNLEFSGRGGSVINQGRISADHVFLVGGSVQNRGSISANKIALAAGSHSVKIDEAAGGEITLIIDEDPFIPDADGELVETTTPPSDEEPDGFPEVVSTDDTTDEPVAAEPATDTVTLDTGDVYNDGSLDAGGETGGQVLVSGNRVAHAGEISADGSEGPGGNVAIRARESLLLDQQSQVSANAGNSGDGGQVIFYSQGAARFNADARVSARGGAEQGAGGFVEFSGAQHIELDTVADVRSVNGSAGRVYIDPGDIDVVDRVTGTPATSSGANPVVFSPNNHVSEVTASSIINQLNFGDVEVNTAGAFNGPNQGTITVRAPLNFTHTVDRTLRLVADESIDFLQGADVQPGSIGAAGLTLDLHANNRVGLFNQVTDLNGGDLIATADADGNQVGNVVMGSPGSAIRARDVKISGHDFHSVNLEINAVNVRLDQTGHINYNGNINAAGELALLADGDLILLGRNGETQTFHGENGVVLSADNDQNMADGLLIARNSLAEVTTGGGPLFVSGHQVDLQDFTLQTPAGNPNLIAVFGSDTVDLSLNDTTPNTVALHRASRFVAEAVNELRLGTPIVASGDALFESTNDQIVHDPPNLAGPPQVTAENAGFKARRGIGSAGSGIDVDVANRLLVQSTNGDPINIRERNNVFQDTGELDSGDLTPFIPPLAGVIATPDVDLAFDVPTDQPPGQDDDPLPPTTPPDMPPTGITSEPPTPTVATTSPATAPPPAPTTTTQIPAFGTVERQRIERAKAAVILETSTARVTAVQFGEFYFLHEKMQISEYANELDLYFIDYLVFGVAEVTADPRVPVEVKGQIIHGGPRPYQL